MDYYAFRLCCYVDEARRLNARRTTQSTINFGARTRALNRERREKKTFAFRPLRAAALIVHMYVGNARMLNFKTAEKLCAYRLCLGVTSGSIVFRESARNQITYTYTHSFYSPQMLAWTHSSGMVNRNVIEKISVSV